MQSVSQLFAEYQQEAFRLELLPEYKVPGEWDDFLEYKKSGALKQNSDLVDYLNAASEKIELGKRHIRVRVIPNPVTEYFIFETKIGYIPQSKIGFELNFLEVEEFKKIIDSLSKNAPLSDFWLFDKQHLVVMEYDTEGQFISAKVSSDKNLISQCIQFRHLVFTHSHSLSYILDKYLII